MTATLCRIPGCHTSGHPRPTDSGRYACTPCTERLRRALREIEDYAAMLDPTPARTGAERHSPGYRSAPPARLDILVALDDRSRPDVVGPDDEPAPVWPILGTLRRLAGYVREARGEPAPATPDTLTRAVGYLLGAVEWVSHQPGAGEWAAELLYLHAQCRRLAGDVPLRPVGACPECAAPLYTPPDGLAVQCRACGREWSGLDLLRLGAHLAAAEAS